MEDKVLPMDALKALETLRQVDIVIGIPSYNNSRTIGHVVRAVHAGLAKYFPQFSSVIINADGGSNDGTREIVASSRIEDQHLLLLDTPLFGVHRLSFPYHGIPGKGSAFRMIFQMALSLKARACAVVDSDLRSITPEWMDLLIRPVLLASYDFVAPYYHRHKYDGTITNSIVYPLTRALYGQRVRQPIGGDFGLSPALLERYLAREDWETDVARYGIDIWMSTIAMAEGFRVCQSFLGAKLHDAKDPGADLSSMLHQVLGSVFALMQQYAPVWQSQQGSKGVDLFGFRYDVGLDPVDVNLERMLKTFRTGWEEMREIWALALPEETLAELGKLATIAATRGGIGFHVANDLWVRIVYDFACAYQHQPIERGHLLRSFTPLYLARVASFVIETRPLVSAEVEDRIEKLCRCFEDLKPYLIQDWAGRVEASHDSLASRAALQTEPVRSGRENTP